MTTARTTDPEWERFAELWLRERPQQLWRRHSDTVNVRLTERVLPRRLGRVLKTDLFDESAGAGLVPALAARAESLVGIDVAEPIVAAARRRYPDLDARRGDVRSLPFPDGSFDAIVSNSTLDHLADLDEIAAAVGELARVLVPGGHLLVTLDNPANPVLALRRALPGVALARVWERRPGLSARFLPAQSGATCDARALADLLRRAGLDVPWTSAVLHVPRAPAVAIADVAERRCGAAAQDRLLRCLLAFESLERLPTRALTGYFVAAHARRPPDR